MKSEKFATAQDYADIIDLPHHVSKRHPQMSMWNRAAQFAPFAALSGHDEAIKETAKENELSFKEKEEPQV
ncbi:MAG: hypothetical protein IKO73_09850 [Bacteroidaceae bacterium]|nr:hypothetical protein [Bacteroidaceae bacterium]